ncbi:diadenylate cyclase CdaA [Tissierella praeacuta]|uniref:Diadenylate cyclase n=1 Tax=Tissierella praeacuta DSM 18095 TaxID=1123404 RepID=A0A1M4W5X8_9FIRM|nr:diadenylate cyclase CdaA [Tissierella praeacuta]MBU5256149.1 diadenylate cyclase CdaA [Tissierella praeacuta]TCU75606.1 diadenylate cyclase [Tissierella praeacuta]SHE76550.1 diadenylate cyclase [Tissierella praeacuta DSM 18095]SUP00056.1 DNA integrity scanning protein DisA [Tissierella praeacuta]
MEILNRLFSNIRIRDVIDIIIVAAVFYKVFKLIRETRAEQLIKGIFVIFVFEKISGEGLLELYTINWILKNTMTVGVIAILIVFQPELRRGLEYIGRSRFFTKSFLEIKGESLSKIVEEIVEACASLSRQKIGALIVLERETGLNEVVETGTKINGVVSSNLLINIFIPNTPLHDGAVIIKEDMIKAAACFLPLTDNMNLSKELGTRHRAALGISERSDSLAIIVSEETGAISIAENGTIARHLDSKTLKQILIDMYKPKDSPQTFMTKWRRKDEQGEE